MSAITLTIDDPADPKADTWASVTSYKHQQGVGVRQSVMYKVTTDFPGTVTLTNATTAESVTLTRDMTTTILLEEGKFHVEVDATGANVDNGDYYIYLVQNESTKELQIKIEVSLAAITCVEYPTLGVSETTIDASNDCVETLSFVGSGATMQLTSWGVPVINGVTSLSSALISLHPGDSVDIYRCPFRMSSPSGTSGVTVYNDADHSVISSGQLNVTRGSGGAMVSVPDGGGYYDFSNQGTDILKKICSFSDFPLTMWVSYSGTLLECYIEFGGVRVQLSSTPVDIRSLFDSMAIGDQMTFFAKGDIGNTSPTLFFYSGNILMV